LSVAQNFEQLGRWGRTHSTEDDFSVLANKDDGALNSRTVGFDRVISLGDHPVLINKQIEREIVLVNKLAVARRVAGVYTDGNRIGGMERLNVVAHGD